MEPNNSVRDFLWPLQGSHKDPTRNQIIPTRNPKVPTRNPKVLTRNQKHLTRISQGSSRIIRLRTSRFDWPQTVLVTACTVDMVFDICRDQGGPVRWGDPGPIQLCIGHPCGSLVYLWNPSNRCQGLGPEAHARFGLELLRLFPNEGRGKVLILNVVYSCLKL